jgi:ubiquinone/menaquinone biosynthesis C-methylase UbiE
MKIIKDQEKFFNEHSHHDYQISLEGLFNQYANKEQINTLRWIADCRTILEYGCGTGTSLDMFFNKIDKRAKKNYSMIGVDIAQLAIDKAKKKYPKFTFYKISNNKIPQIKNASLDGVFMFHVLHHARNHEDIFKEIHRKLKKNGKFLINDLSSNNPINKTARSVFVYMPSFVKQKFGGDLVVGESIPDKYRVRPEKIVKQLKKIGFEIDEVGYGHLFFFLFEWVDKFIPFSKVSLINFIYKQLIKLEENLLHYTFFQKKTELFYIKCRKIK